MDVATSLETLRDQLAQVRVRLDIPQRDEATATARQIVTQLDDYVLPRLEYLDAPVLVVVGGSTGAGKSTLVNTVIGRVVSQSGVVRPTTKSPVLVHHPADAHCFTETRILPGLVRTSAASGDRHSLLTVSEPALPSGLAILDAPDIDSVVSENRTLAAQLLDAADMWLFITSAARYADAVPWEFLRTAAARGSSIAVVVDRVPPTGMGIIPADLGRMMTREGLADAPLFAVPETITDDSGLLPESAVIPIKNYLASLAANKEARDKLIAQTLDGAIVSIAQRAPLVADALEAQYDAVKQLADDAATALREAATSISLACSDGTLLRGEVLSRWHDYVGTTDVMRSVDTSISRLRDRIVGFFSGRPEQGVQVERAAISNVEVVMRQYGLAGIDRLITAWKGNPAGRELLDAHPELLEPSAEFATDASNLIRQWQSGVLDLVSTQGQGKRKSARVAALGVNGVGAALMLVIFFNTGGITGAEGGVAVGTTVVAQRLLESIFGDEAVRRLAQSAKEDLDTRVEGWLARELARYLAVLDALEVDDDLAVQLRNTCGQLQRALGRAELGNDDRDSQAMIPGVERPILEPGTSQVLELTDSIDSDYLSHIEGR